MVVVLRRLVARIREIGLKIRRVLRHRAFFNVPVVEFLQPEKLPFLMPVVIRGRAPKKDRKLTGLRWIKRQKAGWYSHTMKSQKGEATVKVCVGYRRHRKRKDRKQVKQIVVVRCMACVWFSHRHSRVLPPTIWHRDELSANATGTHLHLHS